MKDLRIALTLFLFLLVGSLVSYADQVGVYNFDNDQVGQLTPFAEVSNGITALYTSPSDPATFAVASSIFQSLTGNVLLGNGDESGAADSV